MLKQLCNLLVAVFGHNGGFAIVINDHGIYYDFELDIIMSTSSFVIPFYDFEMLIMSTYII